MSSAWHSRPATPEDGEAIVQLHREVWKEGRPISHWEWKYLNNPTNKMYISVAEYSGRIVGHCALLPTWMNLQGVKVLGAQRTDSMVHPAHRKQGMFASVAQECYAGAIAGGVKLLYHFPNEQSYPVSVKTLSTHKLGELPKLTKILNPKGIIERRIHSAGIATIAQRPAYVLLKLWKGDKSPESIEQLKIRNIQNFDRRFDDLWLKIKDKLSISVWKDSSYLNWRYFSCPDREYVILAAEEQDTLYGFIVLRCGAGQSRTGRIVDFLVLPEKAAAALLVRAGLDFLKDQGMDIAACHIFRHSLFYSLFRDQGFFNSGDRLPLLVRVLTPDLPSTTVLDFRQWHLMEGDIDVF